MISNFKTQSGKDDIKLLIIIVLSFLLVVWFCTPPGNKFLQLCFWGNNTKFFVSKFINNVDSTEYLFHRNNAVYLAKMYKDKSAALKEMNKAFETIPAYASDAELKALYSDRAQIRMADGDYKGALNDYINSGKVQFNDYLRVALLFKVAGNYKMAMSYCNAILDVDNTAYAGYACISDLYASLDRYDLAVKVWNLALDRKSSNAQFYVDRALMKKKLGDLEGYNQDVKKAREYYPTIEIESTLIEETLHPKIITLSIKQ